MKSVVTFLSQVRSELAKVTWPTRNEVVDATIIVGVLVFIFAIILGTMDAIINVAIQAVIGG